MGQADNGRTVKITARLACGKCSIIKSTPHPQAVAGSIECNQRQQDQVQLSRGPMCSDRSTWLRYSKTIRQKPGCISDFCKPQSTGSRSWHNRNITANACFRGLSHCSMRVYFAVVGKIKSYASTRPVYPQPLKLMSQSPGRQLLSPRIQASPTGSHHFANLCFRRLGHPKQYSGFRNAVRICRVDLVP